MNPRLIEPSVTSTLPDILASAAYNLPSYVTPNFPPEANTHPGISSDPPIVAWSSEPLAYPDTYIPLFKFPVYNCFSEILNPPIVPLLASI